MSIKNSFQIFLVSLIVAFLFRLFIIDSFLVSGDSMAPAILSNDYVFINKLAYRFNEPRRGDIVVLDHGNTSIKLIKRIIGLPGERIEISEGIVRVKQNRVDKGQVLDESYIFYNIPKPVILSLDPQEFFVLGDNRHISTDSREFGAFDFRDIHGKVFYILSIKRLMSQIYSNL